MPRHILRHCKHPVILKSAAQTALVVGTILAFINHFNSLLNLDLDFTEFLQIVVTYLVPFLVATYAAARQAHSLEKLEETTHQKPEDQK